MREELGGSRKTDEDVDDLRNHRIHAAEDTPHVHARKGKEEPVQTSHNEEDERNGIE